MPNGDFLENGYYLGFGCDYPVDSPEFFIAEGNIVTKTEDCESLGTAVRGTHHEYIIYCTRQMGGSGWYAIRDGQTLKVWTDLVWDRGEARAESESHNPTNIMWHHYWGIKYASSGLWWYPFGYPDPHEDPPYDFDWIHNPDAFLASGPYG